MRMGAGAVAVVTVASAAALLTGCGDEETTSEAEPAAPITLEAITIPPTEELAGEGDGASGLAGDDPYCALMISAVADYNAALTTYVEDVFEAITSAALSDDLDAVNELGFTVNDLGIASRDTLYDAIEHVDDSEAAHDGIAAMINYVDSYTLPIAAILMAAGDFQQLSEDLTALTQSRLSLFEEMPALAGAVQTYTQGRCGVDLEVLFDVG